jgi:hypothetical protein
MSTVNSTLYVWMFPRNGGNTVMYGASGLRVPMRLGGKRPSTTYPCATTPCLFLITLVPTISSLQKATDKKEEELI